MNLNQIEPYYNLIKSILNKKIKCNEDINDIYQEILISLYLKEELVINYPKTYLANLTNWFIIKHKKNNNIELNDNMHINPCINFNSKDGWNIYHIDDSLLERLESIPKELYEPLYMQVFDNLSIKQICCHLNSNENTIKTRIRRAKIYLRAKN